MAESDPFALFLGAISAGGKLYEGYRGAAAAKISRNIALNNANLYRMQAESTREAANYELDKGAFEISRTHETVERTIGNAKAHTASSGVDVDYGSPLLSRAFSAAQGELDVALIGSRAKLAAASLRGRAASYDAAEATSLYQAEAAEMKGRDALIAGYLGAGTSILSQMKPWAGLSRKADASGIVAQRPGFDLLQNQPSDL